MLTDRYFLRTNPGLFQIELKFLLIREKNICNY